MLLKAPQPLIESPIFDAETLDLFADKVEEISLSAALKKERAGARQIAHTISDIMHNGASDSVRLRAAELASNLAGLGTQKEASNISIVIQDSNVNLANLFCPTR
jgi:hypothetical protein